jgi:alpha-L-fucosidase 2
MKKIYSIVSLLFLLLSACDLAPQDSSSDLSYFFNRPAARWEESFPLGNGRIGMMPDGGVDQENVVLNEISLWSGSVQDASNPQAAYYLGKIRELLFQGQNDAAQKLMYETFVCKGAGSGQGNGANVPYGCYQMLGNLVFKYKTSDPKDSVTDYKRTLSLSDAISTLTYYRGKASYTREAFTSFSGDVGVIHLITNLEHSINFDVSMNRPEHALVTSDNNDLVLRGRLPDGVDTIAPSGMRFEARVRVILPKGGTLKVGDGLLSVSNASEVTILVSMGTDYFSSSTYPSIIMTRLNQMQHKSYAQMKRDHTVAYDKLFGRVKLDLGRSSRNNLPIDRRLQLFAKDQNDPALATLYFQFGRYLLISSTRPGLLPPNLQGLWCNQIQTPWNGDYHLNINLQMNLWPAEVTNLSELQMPLVNWINRQVPSGTVTAQSFYHARGWVTHILGNVWQFTAPGEHPSWGATNTSAAWLCQHLYMHYLYTLDKNYLRSVYPTMRGAALFFDDMLVTDPRSGYLVTAPTTSPENSFRMANDSIASICAGSTMDNQIVRELFTNVIAAAQILKTDTAFVTELTAKRALLKPTTIGSDGRIMEWLQPFREVEPTHRHVSHLYGLYPGNEISVAGTPKLAEAAKKTLEVRGDESTGWSMAWKINFWARLHDGDHAFRLLTALLRPTTAQSGGTYNNLFCAHPPFQIDGNFGGCAGIAEMLVQSQNGKVEVLPALPSAWKSGSFSGLRVRGGGIVSATWKNHRLNNMSLEATVNNHFVIPLPEKSDNLSIRKNGRPASLPVVNNSLEIDLKAHDRIELSF